jgi:hypothetical protein
MISFWDRYTKRIRRAADEHRSLRESQLETWGWCDMRQRDNIRTAANGWAGNLQRPPNERHGRAKTVRVTPAASPPEIAEVFGGDGNVIAPRNKAPKPARAQDERDEVKTVAELAVYVAGVWDTGGAVYCATKTWFGTGLNDAFERLAAQEGLSAVERRATEQNMLATLPPCRNCGCQQMRRPNSGQTPAKVA